MNINGYYKFEDYYTEAGKPLKRDYSSVVWVLLGFAGIALISFIYGC